MYEMIATIIASAARENCQRDAKHAEESFYRAFAEPAPLLFLRRLRAVSLLRPESARGGGSATTATSPKLVTGCLGRPE